MAVDTVEDRAALLLIEHISGHDGVQWVTFSQISDDFRRRYPYESAERPAAAGWVGQA